MVRVDFNITEAPHHILITTPTLQHTQFGMIETVMQGQMPLLVKLGLVSGTGSRSFRGRRFCVSAALDALAVREMTITLSTLLCNDSTTSKGGQSVLGALQQIEHSPVSPCLHSCHARKSHLKSLVAQFSLLL